MSSPPSSTSLLLLVLPLLLGPEVWSYEAPEDEEDVFARRACPAYLTFINAAYLAGVTVELPCQCKPRQVQSVVWFFTKRLGSFEETRALTDHHGNKLLDASQVPHSADLRSRFSIRLFSLLIFRASADDSGIYMCGTAHKDLFYAYDLDIQEAGELSFTPRFTPTRASQRVKSSRGQYQVFTRLRPWSLCDRCGAAGEQVRVGLCYVHSDFLHVRYRRANQTVASCGSGAVPRAFGLQRQSRAGATLEVRSCQVTCPAEAPPSTDLLALMTFLGYSSTSLPVFYLNHPADRVLTLGCPGALPDMAVAWDRGSEPIYRSKHLAGSNISSTARRVLMDSGHHLVFQPATSQDSGVYYCWLQGRRAAEIRVLVYVNLGRGQSVTSHPEFRTAVNTVLKTYAAMTTVFCLLLVGRAGVRHLRDSAPTHVD